MKSFYFTFRWLFLSLIPLLFLCSSCNNTRYLQKDEALLKKNRIVLKNKLKVEKKSSLMYELNTIPAEEPNRKFLGLFRTRLWLHNKTEQDSTKKLKKWLHNRVGEAPVLYDSFSTAGTAIAMQNYLNNKGYFNAKVNPEVEINNQKATVTYVIDTKRGYVIDSLSNRVDDPDIGKILTLNQSKTLLKKGELLDNKTFAAEKNRISKLLRNHGYAYFYPNYVSFKSFDSTDYKVDVSTFILPPDDTVKHQTYTIGKVYIFPGFYPASASSLKMDTLIIGEYYFLHREKMGIKTRPILNAIFLKEGNLFRQSDYDASNKKLSNLGIYKFVSIRYFKNPEDPSSLDFYIYLTPNKKLSLGFDFEVNTSNRSALGTALSISHRNRNTFKGAEIFSINLEGGVEFGFAENNTLLNTLDIGTQFNLAFPKWIVPWKINFNPRHSPKTKLTLDYKYLDRRLYYRNSLFSTSFGYEWQPKPSIRHIFNPISMNFLRINEIRETFQLILDENPFLQASFVDQFFLGGDYSFIYTPPPFLNGTGIYNRTSLTTSGNATYLLDKLIQPDFPFKPFDINYSQFARIENDFRVYKTNPRKTSIAARLFVGVGVPFGNSDFVPYGQQYFSGGTNSMRAWRIRELGPGAYIDTLFLNNPGIQAYQAADFKLEANIEYRFDIISVFEGALFMDVGNIWTLKEDNRGPEAVISADFYKQLAVGAGFGLRLDFSYFIIRLDMGYKLKNPYRDEQTGSYWNYSDKPFRIRDATLNLAVGYPF